MEKANVRKLFFVMLVSVNLSNGKIYKLVNYLLMHLHELNICRKLQQMLMQYQWLLFVENKFFDMYINQKEN